MPTSLPSQLYIRSFIPFSQSAPVLGRSGFPPPPATFLHFIAIFLKRFFTHDNRFREAQELCVSKLLSRLDIFTVIVEDAFTARLKRCVERVCPRAHLGALGPNQDEVVMEGRNFFRPEESALVGVRLHDRAHHSSGADAVTTHEYRFALAFLISE